MKTDILLLERPWKSEKKNEKQKEKILLGKLKRVKALSLIHPKVLFLTFMIPDCKLQQRIL